MILAGVDLESTYIYLMHQSEDRKAETWAQVLRSLYEEQGLCSNIAISDACGALMAGVAKAYKDCCNLQIDVFHTFLELGEAVSRLEAKAYALLNELWRLEGVLNGPKPMQKTRDNYAALAPEIDPILDLVDKIQLLYSWIRELLDFSGYSRSETEALLAWVIEEMNIVLSQYSDLKNIKLYKMKKAVNTFEKRMGFKAKEGYEKKRDTCLSYLDSLYEAMDIVSAAYNVDPSAAHLIYRMRAALEGSPEWVFMNKRVNTLLRKAGVSREIFEPFIQTVIHKAKRSSSFIENVNSRLRPALNDFRGMTQPS